MPSTIKAFKTAQAQVTNAYTYTFTEKDIRRSDGYRLVVSRGRIASDRFADIHRLIYACDLVRSGLTVEAQSVARGPRSRVKAVVLEEGVELVSLGSAVETIYKELDIITNNSWQSPAFRFRSHSNRISSLLSDLRDGNWYGNPNAKRAQGVSNIETAGDKLYGLLLDLLWELDNTSSMLVAQEADLPVQTTPAPKKKTAVQKLRAISALASREEVEEELGSLMHQEILSELPDLREFDSDFQRYSEPL